MIKEPRSMQEIHKIQEKLHTRWKNMSDKEIITDIHQRAEKLIKQHNLKFSEAGERGPGERGQTLKLKTN